jgi:hypothetical protein
MVGYSEVILGRLAESQIDVDKSSSQQLSQTERLVIIPVRDS